MRGGRADSDFQGRALLAKLDIPVSMEATDLLLPLASIASPSLSPWQHCSMQWDVITSLVPARAGEQPGSTAPWGRQPNASHQLGSAAPAPLSPAAGVSLVLLAGMGQTTSQQQAGSFFHPCPASHSCGQRGGMQSAAEDQRGLLECRALAAAQQERPVRVIAAVSHPEHLPASPTPCCNPARGQLYPAPQPEDTTSTQVPAWLRRAWEGREPGWRCHPHLFRRQVLPRGFVLHRSGQKLHPGMKPAEPDTDRATHGPGCPSATPWPQLSV